MTRSKRFAHSALRFNREPSPSMLHSLLIHARESFSDASGKGYEGKTHTNI